MKNAIRRPEFIVCPHCNEVVKNSTKKRFRCSKCGKVIDLSGIVW